jgi:hypothetical protein
VTTVRDALKQAGVDGARLEEKSLEQQDEAPGQVALTVLDPEAPRPSKVRETLDRVREKLTGDKP